MSCAGKETEETALQGLYGVELNPDVFRKAETVEDLFKAIQALQ